MAVHNFDTRIAKKYGVPEAVVLWNICYWQNKNEANNVNFHDGRYWTYNSVSAFTEIFHYLSPKQISRILLKLEKEKAIVSGRYNKMKIDRTKWYSAENEIMALHGFQTILPNGILEQTKMSNPKDKNVQSKIPNEEMEITKREKGIYQMGEAIPDSKQNNKPNQKQHVYRAFEHLSISFKEFEKLESMGFSKEQIDNTLDDVENFKNNKKYASLFLTAKSWLNRERKKKSEAFQSSARNQESQFEKNSRIAQNVAEKLNSIDLDAMNNNRPDPFA